VKLNPLDRAIGYLFPGAGLSRARARAALGVIRGYEAASVGRRTQGWKATKGDANAEIFGSLDRLRDRHRQLVRDNPWAARAVQAIVNNMVGSGIVGMPKSPSGQRAKRLKAAWDSWASSTWCDYERRMDFYGIQALAARMIAESGEVLVRVRIMTDRPAGIVPLALQLLEADHLDHTKNDVSRGEQGEITMGVERDNAGRITHYWLFPRHPGNAQFPVALRSERVPASEVIHTFRIERSGQVRGVPWGAAAMLTLRDLDGFEDAYLLRQKLAACFTAFVHDIDADSAPGPAPGALTPANAKSIETIEPGMVEYLPAGKEVTFASPPKGDDYGPFSTQVLFKVAAAWGVPFEVLTGNLSQVNFSSGRMGWLEFGRNLDAWRWQMFIPQLLVPIEREFIRAAGIALGSTIERGAYFEWTPPRRQMIDPTKEVPATINAIRAGLTSLPAECRALGVDMEDVAREQSEALKMLDELGVVVDSDARRPANGGTPPAAPAPAPPADDTPAARAVAATLDRLAAISERQADLFASAKPPAVTMQPQFHVTVDNQRGGVIREVLETDADGVPIKVIERPLNETGATP
jgi:lambda family phage portal protein